MSGNIGTNAVADLVDNRVAAKASAVQPQEEKAVTGTKRFKKKRKTRCDKGVSKAAAKHGARVDKEAEVSTPFTTWINTHLNPLLQLAEGTSIFKNSQNSVRSGNLPGYKKN